VKLFIYTGHLAGTEIPLRDKVIRIGREASNDVCLDDEQTTRFHAEIRPRGGRYVIADLGSSNGTFVNDWPIGGPHELKMGDRIGISNTQFVCLPEGDETVEEEKGGCFQPVVAILIALVALVGAVLAWRVSVANSQASDADVVALVSVVDVEQTLAANQASLYNDLDRYVAYVIHDTYADRLREDMDRYPSDDPKGTALYYESLIHSDEASVIFGQLSRDYLRADGSYDQQGFLDTAWLNSTHDKDLRPEPYFAQAAAARHKAEKLVGLMVILSMPLFLYTLSEIIKHPIRYMVAGVASLIFFVVIVGAIIVEVVG
jgi:hypothetical protein